MKTLTWGVDDLTKVIERSDMDYSSVVGTVSKIIENVRTKKDQALKDYTKELDKVDLETIRVPQERIEKCYLELGLDVKKAIESAYSNIKKFHDRQLSEISKSWSETICEGVVVGERILPIDSVGCYVPGGRASYPSSVLMTAGVAKVAGVKRIVVVSPPEIDPLVLAACHICGVDEVYQVGGAQAVAALAYGTDEIAKVSKIVGPGNKYVMVAKNLVYGVVDIDMPAGPSEVLVMADKHSNSLFVACEILSQAEHDPNAQCILVTDSMELAMKAKAMVFEGAANSKKKEIIKKSLDNFTTVLTKDISESIDFANIYAAEHLSIQTKDAEAVAKKIENAGAIFIGEYSPVAAGDYASGANHVLPTGGAARFAGQLSSRDFLKSQSIQRISKQGLACLSETIKILAEKEGLQEHKRSIIERLA